MLAWNYHYYMWILQAEYMQGIWRPFKNAYELLTQWGRVTHIYVSKLTTIDSDNGFSSGQRQSIIWTNAGIL